MRALLGGLLVAAAVGVWTIAAPTDRAEAQPGPVGLFPAQVGPVPNPPITETCGVDVTLVLDASGSINSAGAVGDVRDAADAFLQALKNTDSTARVTQFATASEQLAAPTLITDATLGPGGPLRQALSAYYNPKPPRPGGVDWYQYRRGDPTNPNSFRRRSDNQYTNWDQSLRQAADTPAEIVVYITDGKPSAYDLDKPGDPFDQGPPPDVAWSTDRSQADAVTLERAVEEADIIKTASTRMLAIGVGDATGSTSLQNRLVAISGPQVVKDADLDNIDSLNDIDVAIVSDFDNLAAFLRQVVLELCSPSLTITKFAQTADNPAYDPAPGWLMTVTPTVPGGGTPPFNWILPDTTPAVFKTLDTNANGSAAFQWEPNPAEEDSRASVQETLEPGYIAGRPSAPDYRCELRDENGNTRVQEGELDGDLSFVLDPIRQEVVTCSIWNSFDYQPAISLSKVNNPPEVRGDLDPAAVVTSTYAVTNTGNTPLGSVSVTDNRCSPTEVPPGGPNAGDTNGDGLLDPGEIWQFTCNQSIRTADSTDPVGQTIVNTAEATGTDPTGTVVTDGAFAQVVAFNPKISVDKLVDGAKSVTVAPGAEVTYTYDVRNEGNVGLSPVALTDDTPPCDTGITRLPDVVGNDDNVLDVGEHWAYSCTANPTAAVVNTATVSGLPLNPFDGNQPFPDPNPTVTDTSQATVSIVDAGIELTKSANPNLLLLDAAGTVQPVAYTFEAANTGTNDLVRPDGLDPKDVDWITDPICAPINYDSGDTNSNDRIDASPAETWVFTCSQLIDQTTVNTAEIIAQPTETDGTPIPGLRVSDNATAIVEVFQPGLAVAKSSLRPFVVDPGADAVSGPDVPRRPAEYVYEVDNTGSVPLDLDPDPPVDDKCAPLAFQGGDTDGDGLLDTSEVWTYTCSTLLDRLGDSNNPPVTGSESGNVKNTVTVTGVPFFLGQLVPDKSVTATNMATTSVIQPGIAITKTPSADIVVAGTDVTYTFVVDNLGDVALKVVGPQDDKCSPLVFQGGDIDGNGLLDGANTTPESWTYTCTRTLQLPPPPDLTDQNSVEVGGIDPLGNLYQGVAFAEVRVFAPAINLNKTVSESLVPAGTAVTYDYEVTNTGQSPLPADDVLAQIQLGDVAVPPQPSCTTPTFTGGDINNNGLLDRLPAETWRYECTATINDDTTNIAAVTGVGGTTFNPPLPIDVVAASAAFVQVFHPEIDIVKTADPTQLLGSGPVTYTYEVTNPGDVPLADVASRIVDDKCSPVTLVSGDDNNNGLLDTANSIFESSDDETWIFTCTTTITEDTKNTVTVTGTPTDAGAVNLCGPVVADLGRILQPCDVTDMAMAMVTVTDPGTIVIEKRAEPDDTGTDFDFTLTGQPGFTLADGETETFTPLAPGDYTVAETVPAGWELVDLTCVDPSGGTTTDPATGTATIDLAAGETVTCTYSNVQLAGIVVRKVTDPDTALRDFDFGFVDGGSTQLFDLANGELQTFGNLLPGDYTVSETVPVGWDLTDLTCIDPSGGTTTSGSTADIDLAAGEVVDCTYTNTQRGAIIVEKVAAPDDTTEEFEFALTGQSDFTLGNGDNTTFSPLEPGQYDLTETIPAGWDLFQLECVDPSGNTTTDPSTGLAAITLDPGETVRCTFTNIELAGIVVSKATDPAGSPQEFDFDVTGPPGSVQFPLGDGEFEIVADLLPGTYTVTETIPAGWDLTGLVCDPAGGVTTDPDAGTAEIVLGAGDIVACEYTNTELGTIVIEKQTLPDGSPQVFDFTLTGQAPFQLSDGQDNTVVDLAPGEYTAVETLPAGWQLDALTCVDPNGNTVVDPATGTATINLEAGETVTCTYENTQQGSIVIVKETDPDGSNQLFDFTLTGQMGFQLGDGTSSTFTNLPPGDYSAVETVPDGWALTGLVCVDPTGDTGTDLDTGTADITLGPGETVTCTYTNTQQAVFVVVKQTDPETSDQDFDFDFDGTAFQLRDDGSRVFENLTPGDYTATETIPPGWELGSIVCTDDTAVVDTGAGTVDVTLSPGELVSCTYTNVQLASIVIAKETLPDPDPSAQQFGFTLTGQAGFDLTGGTNMRFDDLDPGEYTAVETLPTGWELTDLTCIDPSGGTTTNGATATIDLAAGETVTCTYTNAALGSIVINKQTDPDQAADDFDFDFNGSSTFQLAGGGTETIANLPAGDYAVTETVLPGWELTGIVCVDPSGGTTTDPSTGLADIELAVGETVTCTYTNVELSAIVVVKETDPTGVTDTFPFTATGQPGFDLADGEMEIIPSLRPGTYTVAEIVPAGWELADIVCVDPTGDSTTDPTTGEAEVVLDADEIVTCTFSNTQQGTIIVVKETDPAGATDEFGFTLTGETEFTLTDGASETFTGLAPGDYTLAEVLPDGWQLTALECVDPTDNSLIDLDAGSADLALGPGETISCTFSNTQQGTITVVKEASPADTDQQFGFTIGDTTFTLGAGDSTTSDPLPPGDYKVTETATSGWQLTGLVCEDPTDDSTTDLDTASADIALGAGENVTCTFSNLSGKLPVTGSSGVQRILTTAALVLLVGLVLWAGTRRRRTPLGTD